MQEDKSFQELLDGEMNIPLIGKIVKGTVVRIDGDDVFIDFGYKSEGVVPKSEFFTKDGDFNISIGDKIEVILENWNRSGPPRLSKEKALLSKENSRLREIFESNEKMNVKILDRIKGGFLADIGKDITIKAFLPGSQVDFRPLKNPDKIVGTSLEARIITFKKDNVVISRRVHLEEERETKRKETLSNLEEGNVISGQIVKIIDSGVFVDIGGLEGFIPVGELSWGRIRHPKVVVSENEELEVVVLKIEEPYRVTLGRKQVTADPWSTIEEKYQPGQKIEGRVVSITDFGAFIELEAGIEGLAHLSEITWIKNFSHPKEVLSKNTSVEAIVLDVDKERKRISLSLKKIAPSPWEIFREQNKKGSKITGEIKNVNNRGIFVEVGENLVGLVRPDNISWKGRVNPTDNCKINDKIEVAVLDVDPKNERISLGVKQLTVDPWQYATANYTPNETSLKGKIKEVNDWAIIVKLNDDISGFIRASEISNDLQKKDLDNFKIDDDITALVTGFNKNKRQINLSIKKLEKKLEKDRISSFITNQGEANLTLGDILGDKLKSLNE